MGSGLGAKYLLTQPEKKREGVDTRSSAEGRGGQVYSAYAKKLYFGMEPITQVDWQGWQTYVTQAAYFTNAIARAADRGMEKYERFSRRKTGRDVLDGIRGGIAGFNLYASKNDFYVSYASTLPGRVTFGKVPDSLSFYSGFTDHDLENLEEKVNAFRNAYGTVIMSVGSTLWKGNRAYENRGIFRNPLSVLDKTHPNISLDLHGFTAEAVTKKLDSKMEYLFVSALDSMANVLKRGLGDVIVTESDAHSGARRRIVDSLEASAIKNKAVTRRWKSQGLEDTTIFIPIKPLLKMFSNAKKNPPAFPQQRRRSLSRHNKRRTKKGKKTSKRRSKRNKR